MREDEIYKYSVTTAYSYSDWKLVCKMLEIFGGVVPDIGLLDKLNQIALRLNVTPIRIAMFLTQ